MEYISGYLEYPVFLEQISQERERQAYIKRPIATCLNPDGVKAVRQVQCVIKHLIS